MQARVTKLLALPILAAASPAIAAMTTYVNDTFDTYNNGDAILTVDPTHWVLAGDSIPTGSTATATVSITTSVSPDNSLKMLTESGESLFRPRWNRDLTAPPASAASPITAAQLSFDFNYNYDNSLSDQGGMPNKGYAQDEWIYVRTPSNQIVGQIRVNGGYYDWRFGTNYHLGATSPNVRDAAWHNVGIAFDFVNQTATYSLDGVQQYSESVSALSGSTGLGFVTFENGINGPDGVENNTNFLDNVIYQAEIPALNPEWKANADGNWSEAGNWTGAVPNAIGASAKFGSAIQAAHTVTVDVPITVGKIEFDNTNAYTIAGANTLTLNDSAGSSIAVSNGSHNISAPVSLATNTTVTVANAADTLTASGQVTAAAGVGLAKAGPGTLAMANVRADSLSISGGTVRVIAGATPNDSAGTSVVKSLAIAGGNLDLSNNSMVIDYSGAVGTLVDDVRQHLTSGRLTSSSADATRNLGYADNAALGLTTFAGQTVDADSVLVKYTYLGDTNLDGQVDVIDLGNLATAWQTNGVWANGDSNYDGFVDVIDLGQLATNWQAGVGSPLGPGSLSEALAAYGLPGASVPEPASVALAGLLGGALLHRRRR